MAASAPVHWLVHRIRDRSARGIAAALGGLIRDGELPPGTRLPTVRSLAAELSVSPATVADSWSTLRGQRLIDTGRRRGTTTLAPPTADRGPGFRGWAELDLGQGLPDASLLPPLADAVAAGVRTERLNGVHQDFITPRLFAAVAPTWPFRAAAWTVVAGGYEGTMLACQAVAEQGELIAIEEPTAPRLLDTLRNSGIRVVPVRCDEHGPDPEALARALCHGPAAFLYQPRAHVPYGHTVTAERSAALADVLENEPGVSVVEDDNLGPLASAPVSSIGAHLPERTLLVRSFCKAYGLELRSCVVAGAEDLVGRVRLRQGFGMVWTSRILQDALAYLIEDQDTAVLLRQARAAYTQRRDTLVAELRARGIDVRAGDGLVLWVPVPDEARAIVALARHGVGVGPGSRCYVRPPVDAHIRIATSQLPDDPGRVAELATIVARAVTEAPRAELD